MNQVVLSGEVIASKETYGQHDSERNITFQIESRDKYKAKDGMIKTWTTKIRCFYKPLEEHESIQVGDFVYLEGSVTSSQDKSSPDKAFYMSIKAKAVSVIAPAQNKVTPDKYSNSPRYDSEQLDF